MRCKFYIKETGKYCGANALIEDKDGFCFRHSKVAKEKSLEASRKGGKQVALSKAELKVPSLKNIKEILRFQRKLLRMFVKNEISEKRFKLLFDATALYRQGYETGEIEPKVDKIIEREGLS